MKLAHNPQNDADFGRSTLIIHQIGEKEDQNMELQQMMSKSSFSESYNNQGDRQIIQKQYSQFFNPVAIQLQKFKLDALPEEVYRQHGVRILSHRSDRIWSRLISEGLTYVQLINSVHSGLECVYNVVIGYFFMTVKVINIHANSQLDISDSEFLGEGSYGKVRKLEVGGKEIALKKIIFAKKKTLNLGSGINEEDYADYAQIRKVISQYCLYKICSMLKIGPQVIFENGYDLVCYNNCIEFQMELCEQVNKKIDFRKYETDLKRCLGILHSLKIIHKDVKKSNTLFSPAFNSFVLSDFGLTHSVKEEVWQKTETFFAGSLGHVSEEMEKLLCKKEAGLVNLYLNDVHGLQATIAQMREEQRIYSEDYKQNSMSIGKHMYESEDYAQQYSYVSSEQEEPTIREVPQVKNLLKQASGSIRKNNNSSKSFDSFNHKGKELQDRTNYYFIGLLSQFLASFNPDRPKKQYFAQIQKLVQSKIKSQPNLSDILDQLQQALMLVVSRNIEGNEIQITHLRNIIRMFGQNSIELYNSLSELNKDRKMKELDYQKIQSYLGGFSKPKQITMKKFKNNIINMDRHYLLRSRRSVANSLRTLIQQYYTSKQKTEEERKQILLLGLQALGYQELTQIQNSELISKLFFILKGVKVPTQKVNSDLCLSLCEDIFYKYLNIDSVKRLAMLNSIIKLSIRYNSPDKAKTFYEKLIKFREQLQVVLLIDASLEQSKKKEIKLNIIRHVLGECVYLGLVGEYEMGYERGVTNYNKFTEYCVEDNSVKINVLDSIVNHLIKLKKFQQAESYNEKLGDLIIHHCLPKKKCIEFAFFYFHKAVVLAHKKQYEEALKNYEVTLSCIDDSLRGPSHVKLIKETLFNISNLYTHLNQPQKSIQYNEKCLSVELAYNKFNEPKITAKLMKALLVKYMNLNQKDPKVYFLLKKQAQFVFQFMKKTGLDSITMTHYPILQLKEFDNLTQNGLLFLKKQLIYASRPYLPAFSHYFVGFCQNFIKKHIIDLQFAKTQLYYALIFSSVPEKQVLAKYPKAVDTFITTLNQHKQFKRIYKFLRKVLHDDLPSEYKQKYYREMWRITQIPNLNLKFDPFLMYQQRYWWLENADNVELAANNMRHLQLRSLAYYPKVKNQSQEEAVRKQAVIKKIWERRLMKIRNMRGREGPWPWQVRYGEAGENPENSGQVKAEEQPILNVDQQKFLKIVRYPKENNAEAGNE